MSPVRMMTGTARCSFSRTLATTSRPFMRLGRLKSARIEVGPENRLAPATASPRSHHRPCAIRCPASLSRKASNSRNSGSSSTTRIAPVARRSSPLAGRDAGPGVHVRAPAPLLRPRDFDGEDRALALERADAHAMAQKISQALHDGQAETKAAAAFARCIVELMVLVEDRLVFVLGYADAGVPDLDAQHSLRRRQPSSTLPCLVYFSAFDSRLRSICSSMRGSLRIDRVQGPRARRSFAPARDK